MRQAALFTFTFLLLLAGPTAPTYSLEVNEAETIYTFVCQELGLLSSEIKDSDSLEALGARGEDSLVIIRRIEDKFKMSFPESYVGNPDITVRELMDYVDRVSVDTIASE